MKLTRKLTLLIAAAVVLVLSVVGFLRVRLETSLYEQDLRRDHHVLGRAMAAAVGEAWRLSGRRLALDVIDHANSEGGPVHVRWVDPAAAPDSHDAPVVADLGVLPDGRETHRVLRGEGSLVTYEPLPPGEGALELTESLGDEARYIRRTIVNTVIATSAIAGALILTTFVFGSWMVGRPIQALRKKAQEVGEGKLETPVFLAQDDELGQLARDMNSMSAALAAAQERARVEAEARLETLEQLRHAERLATVGKLASGFAHELGTPLNVVSANAKLIENGELESPEGLKGAARAIQRQTQRIANIVRQLLGFARPHGPVRVECDLVELAHETAQMLASLSAEHDVRVRVHAHEPVRAPVDATQLQQVLTNLIVNAVQAMPDGGTVNVTVTAEHEERVAICVQDAGKGIPQKMLSHLFEPFYTTKEVGQGTGLGLSVSYGIVRDHGGWISVDTSPEVGSSFTVHLPTRVSSTRAA
jgi:signal transduction histidine kinase